MSSLTDKPTKTAISIQNVSKTFKLPHEKQTSIKSLIINFYKHNRSFEKQRVLHDISVDIKEGEFFGIVGRNGSGKSTLLKLLAGIYNPDQGNITVNGSLTPFIELGVGFNPELTGRENIFLNGALLGFDRREMAEMYDDIVSFAELEKFMDQKLKNYSSGMQVRLAFSIAIRARSDVLLLDEVLAVGDAIFQKKCFSYFRELKRQHKTVVFISHDPNALLEYCDQGILIDKGKIVSRGPIKKVVNDYIDLLNGVEEEQSSVEAQAHEQKKRWGTGAAFVNNVTVLNKTGDKQKVFTEAQDTICVEVGFSAKELIERPIYGITITDAAGERLFTSNTLWSRVSTKDLPAGEKITVRWNVPNAFNTGDFTISPAIASPDGSVTYDWLDAAATFKVRKKLESHASINLPHDIEVDSA